MQTFTTHRNLTSMTDVFLFNDCGAVVGEHDVWKNLRENVDHFFWLTGETPETLNALIHVLKDRYRLTRRKGRLSCLSVHNQVQNYIHPNKLLT